MSYLCMCCHRELHRSALKRDGDFAKLTLVSQHKGNRHQPKFTSPLPFHAGVKFLQPVYEQEGQ